MAATVSVYVLAQISSILSTWLNVALTIAVIFSVLHFADKTLYRIGIDFVELMARWQAARCDYERKQMVIAHARLELRENRRLLLSYLDEEMTNEAVPLMAAKPCPREGACFSAHGGPSAGQG